MRAVRGTGFFANDHFASVVGLWMWTSNENFIIQKYVAPVEFKKKKYDFGNTDNIPFRLCRMMLNGVLCTCTTIRHHFKAKSVQVVYINSMPAAHNEVNNNNIITKMDTSLHSALCF